MRIQTGFGARVGFLIFCAGILCLVSSYLLFQSDSRMWLTLQNYRSAVILINPRLLGHSWPAVILFWVSAIAIPVGFLTAFTPVLRWLAGDNGRKQP